MLGTGGKTMTEHKYTDEEVIKALECCASHLYACEDCHYLGKCRLLEKDAIDLINRQKAEISALTSAVDNSTQEFLKLHDKYQDQKAEIERLNAEKYNLIKTYKFCMVEAIKEFAKKLGSYEEVVTTLKDGKNIVAIDVHHIHRLVKEMTGENNQ
jgi:septal ring factor EnvC (AmiA/AmiB activator)